jgi:signal transduction histidine kinase
MTVPFLVLAAVTGAAPGTEAWVLTVVLAALVPAAAWAGVARGWRAEALLHTAATQAIAGTLVERTARGERARIARELHDVVAHHISMIAVQAETARLTTPGMPAAGAQRLSEIGDTARAGLTEMRRLLGVLREDAEAESADRHPQPGLAQLPGLVDEARESSGARCRLIIAGAPVAADPGVGLAAYRIVQEALTNARRHAPGAAVDVEVRYGDGELRLLIRDNGPGPQPVAPAGGHGLHGMRERAAAVGGDLRAGAATVGGFLVQARLPGKCGTGG